MLILQRKRILRSTPTPSSNLSSMSSQGHSPPVASASKPDQSGRGIRIPDPSLPSPPRKPPTLYLGRQQIYNQTMPNQQVHDQLRREHDSTSSTSTDSGPQNTAHERADPMHIYAPAFSSTAQAERGTLEIPRSTRAYPNQYTRPSRSEMAEINAVYQHSHEEYELSQQPEDHAIWVVVSCYCCH